METAVIQIIPFLLSIITGVYICAALYHFCFAVRRVNPGINTTFAIMCVFAAGYSLSEQAIYASSSIDQYIYALKWMVSWGIAFLASATWFMFFFNGSSSRSLAIWLNILAIILILANKLLPLGLLFREARHFEPLLLPWNEAIAYPQMEIGWGLLAQWLFAIFVYAFILNGCWHLWRQGRRRGAVVMSINVLLFLVAGIVDLGVDLRKIHWIYVAEFRFLCCVVSMAIYTSKFLRLNSD